MKNSQIKDYVILQLKRNPLEAPGEILKSRRCFLQQEPLPDTHTSSDLSFYERREQTLKKLRALRASFWSLKTPVLQQQMDAFDLTDFPDLSLSLHRLEAVSLQRESFRQLEAHPASFEEFLKPFRELLIAAPQRAAELREELQNALKRTSGNQQADKPQEYRYLIYLVRKDFPELYALEQTWLDQLLKPCHTVRIFGLFELVLVGFSFLILLILYALI